MLDQAIAVVLAGNEGAQLAPLTAERAKPAVPFGGKYRIIDFTLANCLHSGLRRILVLTQFHSHSLNKHLRDGWSVFNPEFGEYITAVPPQMRGKHSWYRSTADAIYQNLYLLSRSNAKYVVILPGDHIYRMDYAPMLKQHIEHQADLTVAYMQISSTQASRFDILSVDEGSQQITAIQHYPDEPLTLSTDSNQALASMGIYIFSIDKLTEILKAHVATHPEHFEFSLDILPKLIDAGHAYGYLFGGREGRVSRDCYWQDVETLDSYYQANMDLLQAIPPIDLYQRDWPIRSYQKQVAPAKMVSGASGTEGIVINSIAGGGVVVTGGCVQQSILFPDVEVHDEAVIEKSILFENVVVGAACRLQNCIIDKHVVLPPGTEIGVNAYQDKQRFTISEKGIVIVPRGYQFTE